MKKIIFSFLFVAALWLTTGSLFSQVGINDDGSLPNSSAILDVQSTSKGLLLPRMTSAQMNAIPEPVAGMMVYCTDCNEDGCSGTYTFTWTVYTDTTASELKWVCVQRCTKPGQAGAITGTATVSSGQNGVSYSIPGLPRATTYTWTYTGTGFSSTTKTMSPSIMADFSESATSGDLTVKASNSCGSGAASPVFHITVVTGNCPNFPPFDIRHVPAGDVAPVTKSVTYNTVTGIPGEEEKCWISQNLGADHQATAKDDASEAPAGWYWQFNRKQGYKHDGSERIPNSTWNTLIDDTAAGLEAGNDPCILELGNGWRIPTSSEWTNVDAGGGWTNWNDPWNSNLRLHAAGYLSSGNGTLTNRGSGGYYLSSTQYNSTTGYSLKFSSSISHVTTSNKESGIPVRCINDCANTIHGGGPFTGPNNVCKGQSGVPYSIGAYSGAPVYTWAYSGSGFTITSGSGTNAITASFSSSATSGVLSITVMNSCNNFSISTTMVITVSGNCCGQSPGYTINHVAGAVAPVTKTVTYTTVTNIPGEPAKCWITSNLGASRQALAENDNTEASAGWYWQFNRKQGYQHTGTARTPNTTWIDSINEDSNWQASNDPCALFGQGWRLPTSTEWNNVDAAGHWNTWYEVYKSNLRLHAAGRLNENTGSLESRGITGNYWSSTQSPYTNPYKKANYFNFSSASSYWTDIIKTYGFTVRCIRDGN
jgi:hypothetical protein